MQLFDCRIHLLAAILLQFFDLALADAWAITTITSTIVSLHSRAPSAPPNATCESRTINYITHSLASVCLRQNRTHLGAIVDTPSTSSSPPAEDTLGSRTETVASAASTLVPLSPTSAHAETVLDLNIDPESALDDASFLSFEDWKKQTLEKEGVVEAGVRDGEKRRRIEGVQSALEGLAEGGDIDLDFGAYLGDRTGEATTTHSNDADTPKVSENSGSGTDLDEKPRYQSKDAGKTSKERYNFASLDVGGQVMKSNPEAKSASALLSENRDVYMLNTCQAKNKFFIVELSEAILVDTVAMANFEFFSSTFREFRVSVSDWYPVKLDRWVEIGVFEARNSREIQAFIVEDPRIWARYLRVEFLSHFGNEFYCPVSLLRVHGRTMIQDVLDMEQGARGEDDVEDDQNDLREGESEVVVPEAVAEVLKKEEKAAEGLEGKQVDDENPLNTVEDITARDFTDSIRSSHIMEAMQSLENIPMTTPWIDDKTYLQAFFDKYDEGSICLPSEAPEQFRATPHDAKNATIISKRSSDLRSLSNPVDGTNPTLITSALSAVGVLTESPSNSTKTISSTDSAAQTTSSPVPGSSASSISISSPVPNKAQNVTATMANQSSGTATSYTPQPTTQESFFKNLSKRLQLLEANATLSLKYIEEQSRILRDAFTKVEKRQLAKTTSFLENLNSTVLEELRQFSKQYDQIWQSTVMELETQREQSQRETAAVSARLNILADELVFQKRMSIVQSILLLLCLAVVVFSRSLAGGNLETPIVQNMVSESRNAPDYPYASPPDSPETQRAWSPPEARPWNGSDHRRQRSDESGRSLLSRSQEYSPPTPFSTYSGHEEEYNQDGHGEDLNDGENMIISRDDPRDSLTVEPSYGMGGTYSAEESPKPGVLLDFMIRRDSSPRKDTRPATLGTVAPLKGPKRLPSEKRRPNDSASANPNNDDTQVDQDQTGIEIFPPSLPSSPQRVRDNHDFSIARKPLPALPRDEN